MNGCLEFSGTDDELVQIDELQVNHLLFQDDPFTLTAWVYPMSMPSSTVEQGIITMWDQRLGQDHRHYRMFLENDDSDTTGQFTVELFDENSNQSITASSPVDSISEDTWYHVALSYNGAIGGSAGDLLLYVDGVLTSSNSSNASFSQLRSEEFSYFGVGGYNTSEPSSTFAEFAGRIDEPKVYTTQLTTEQVLIDFNLGSAINFGNGSHESSLSINGAGNAPIAYWPLDENTGTTTSYDRSSNSNDLTLTNVDANDWSAGRYGSALRFNNDGVGDERAVAANESNFDFGTGSFTISGWVKFSDHSSDTFEDNLITKYCSGTTCSPTGFGYSVYVAANSNNLCFGIDDDSTWSPDDSACGGSYGDNMWHFFTAIKNTTTSIELYVDGVYVASDTSLSATGSLDNAAPVTLANNHQSGIGSSRPAVGALDDVRIYDYARTKAQIAYDYNRGEPIGWWRFDDCSGTTANDASG
ncbi:LamG domain-containing protein, partial [candidate division WWE3 bacterium]|nr:LamG domain-containing protein [candidate division WWE3 bacterium]